MSSFSFDFTWPDLYKLLYGKLGNDHFVPTHDELLEEFRCESLEANNFELYRVIASIEGKPLINRMRRLEEERTNPPQPQRIKEAKRNA